jgi:hypothetical protein
MESISPTMLLAVSKTFWLPQPSCGGSKHFRRNRRGIRFSSQFSGRAPPFANIDPNLTRTRLGKELGLSSLISR